jgi:hypothetical protein
MNSDVHQNIIKIEKKWLHTLYDHIKTGLANVWIPSHDETHSLRVWFYACQLFLSLEQHNIIPRLEDIEKAIIAIFFHDLGMSESLRPEHGIISRRKCEGFFKKNNLTKPEGFSKILDAIEYHDDKTYREFVFKDELSKTDVLTVLCISDDLDAFGLVGVYRFWEIYSLRQIPEKMIPLKALSSLENRFDNFSKGFSFLNDFFENQKSRFLRTRNFFSVLSNEMRKIEKLNKTTYAIKVISLVKELVLHDRQSPEIIYQLVQQKNINTNVLDFFKNFDKEYNIGQQLLIQYP